MKDFSELKDKVLSTIGKAAETGKDIAAKAADAGKDAANKAAAKAKTGTRIAKLSIDIANEKENMKKTYIEIGKLYYDMHKDDPEGFFIQLCDEVTLAMESVAAKQAEIDELRAQGGEEDGGNDITVEFEEVVAGDETEAAAEEAEAEPEQTPAEEKSEDEASCCCGCGKVEEPAEEAPAAGEEEEAGE